MQVQVSKWGNSLGVRIPKDIAGKVGLKAGTRVEVETDDDRIVISVKPGRYTLPDLLRGMTPDTMRDAFDWGGNVGRENVPD